MSLPADNKDGRYFITGTHALSSCHIVTSGQYYIAGVIKLGETAIKFFVSDTRPPYKHPGRSSAAGIAASEQSNMAAGDADAHVASADLAAAAEDDESADVPDLDAAELAVDDAEAEEAAEAAAAAEAEAGQAAGAAAAAAAGPIEEQLQLPGPLYQVVSIQEWPERASAFPQLCCGMPASVCKECPTCDAPFFAKQATRLLTSLSRTCEQQHIDDILKLN